jgi:phosphopantothenoylcysteine synthetase/decarboxylase
VIGEDLSPDVSQDSSDAPTLGFSRLCLVVTGSAIASSAPAWLTWLTETYPDLEVRTLLTRSARRFTTLQALDLRSPLGVEVDEWTDTNGPLHVELAQWMDGMVVYPATYSFTSRLAAGLADSPAVLAALCTPSVVALAPALPPNALQNHAFAERWQTLGRRPNVVLAPPRAGVSLSTGRNDGWVCPPLWDVLRLAEHRRRELERVRPGHDDHPGRHLQAASLLADGQPT